MRHRVRAYWSSGWNLIPLTIVLMLGSCSKQRTYEKKVIFTQVPAESITAAQLKAVEGKYAPNMKIVMADIDATLHNIEILTEDFFSARSPELSADAKNLVFSAQKVAGDIWQIWILEIDSKQYYQVSESRTNCTDPAWLPDGSIVFSKLLTEENSLKYHALFTIGIDGCCEQRITFQPHNDVNSTVLHDGRILVSSRQIYPETGVLKYLALRPDGTKAEVFHIADEGASFIGKAVEDAKGLVLFSEDKALASIRFNRPLHSKSVNRVITEDIVHSIFVMKDDQLLVSRKKQGELTFGISILGNLNAVEEKFHKNNKEYHMVEAQLLQSRPIPKILPTRVNPDINYGYALSMNADASTIDVDGKTATVQVFDMSDMIGEIPVESDGSFYLELPSDRPLRFQTLDDNGNVLRGPSSWMWLRPNERRACVGCHQDREVTPENIVPLAVKNGPFAMYR